MNTRYSHIESPVGRIWVAWCDEGLVSVGFVHQTKGAQIDADWEYDPSLRCDAVDQLRAYFSAKLRHFELPLVIRGTDFQQRVWRELANIPYGETTTYGEIASRLGKPSASRAVGAANGQNRIAIVLPCHRVIGRDGSLTGFAGGIEAKSGLLEFERQVAMGAG